MERTEIFAKVADVASDILGVDIDSITEQTSFDDLDADSLDRLQLVTAMEDEFDIEFILSFRPEFFTCRRSFP